MRPFTFLLILVAVHGASPLTAQHGAGEVQRSSGIIEIGGAVCPYLLEGEGVPCLVVGPAFFYSQFFSDELKQHIQFVLVDFKNTWRADESVDVSSITMADLVDEIDEVREALGFERFCVLGASVLGFWPLEYAKAYPDRISHAIMIGTPPFWNFQEIEPIQDEFIANNASKERRERWDQNWERVSKNTLERLSPMDRSVYTYVQNAPLYWFDFTYDPFHHFAGRQSYEPMKEHVFDSLLADYDPRDQFAAIETPVFLALGRHDYVLPFTLWDEARDLLPNLSYHLFERSGHFPMFEEQELFDKTLVEWLGRTSQEPSE